MKFLSLHSLGSHHRPITEYLEVYCSCSYKQRPKPLFFKYTWTSNLRYLEHIDTSRLNSLYRLRCLYPSQVTLNLDFLGLRCLIIAWGLRFTRSNPAYCTTRHVEPGTTGAFICPPALSSILYVSLMLTTELAFLSSVICTFSSYLS